MHFDFQYWQSEGESRKTSMRIKTRLDQMRAEGLYTGGPVRFGYQAIEKGRLNKKNKPVKDLVINPEEDEEVIYDTYREGIKKIIRDASGGASITPVETPWGNIGG